MKILQVIQRFPPAVGGGEEVVFQLSKALANRGHELTVATSNWLYDSDVPGISASRLNLRWPKYQLPFEESIDKIRIMRFKPWLRFWTYSLNPGLMSFLLNHANEYDIIHAHYLMFAESDIAALASRLSQKPFILTNHGSLKAIDLMGGAYRLARHMHNKTIGRLTLSQMSAIIVLDENMKYEFEQIGVSSEKIKFIPNGIDLLRFRQKKPSRNLSISLGCPDHVVLFVGRLEQVKGPQYLIEAVPLIISEFPNTKFIFVGEDWGYGRELISIAEKLNVKERLLFVGRITGEKLIDYYNIADVLVFLSLGGGFGQVALESIACCTPTVLIKDNDLLDILDPIGISSVDMHCEIASQIALSVIRFFSSPNIKTEMRIQRLKLEEKLGWQNIAKATEQVYWEAIKR